MFPEHRLLHAELNAYNLSAVKEMCAIIIAKDVWIGQTIVTHVAGFPRVDANRIRHFIQPFE